MSLWICVFNDNNKCFIVLTAFVRVVLLLAGQQPERERDNVENGSARRGRRSAETSVRRDSTCILLVLGLCLMPVADQEESNMQQRQTIGQVLGFVSLRDFRSRVQNKMKSGGSRVFVTKRRCKRD